ncbi:MAG: hypothetical protein ACJAT2_001526 [Bacteriovoracaceae bacterium]|jgi:hypothetical protein
MTWKSNSDIKVNSIFLDIILTLCTFGIWNLWVQLRQISDANEILGSKEFPSILKLVLLSLITFGIYFIYHEYTLTKKLHVLNFGEEIFHIEIFIIIFTVFGLWFLVDSYQQSLLNKFIETNR